MYILAFYIIYGTRGKNFRQSTEKYNVCFRYTRSSYDGTVVVRGRASFHRTVWWGALWVMYCGRYMWRLWVRACGDRYIKEYEECYWHPRAVLLPDIPPAGCLSHTTLIIDKPTPILTTRQIGMSSNVNTRVPVVMDSSFTRKCRRSISSFSRI